MHRSIRLSSYSKVNFTLDVMNPRSDGFHSIASVMQTISLFDTISISILDSPGISFECNAVGIPSESTNLSYRAAQALLDETGTTIGLHIKLTKVIPSQAGLGGGSSNAAYTLLAVNRLLRLDVEDRDMMAIASSLGSDVPFFLKGGTCVARGRGELISPLLDATELFFVIVKPSSNVSTAAAYMSLDAIQDRQSIRGTNKMEASIAEGDVDRIISRMSNDFERAIYSADPLISALSDDFMMARAENARLCGSGAAVFGVCRTQRAADETARMMRLKYPEVYVCHSVNRHDALNSIIEESL